MESAVEEEVRRERIVAEEKRLEKERMRASAREDEVQEASRQAIDLVQRLVLSLGPLTP